MAALPDNLSDLHPQTSREWFQFLNTKIDTILESQAEDRETVISYMDKTNDWIKCHDRDLKEREKLAEKHTEKIDQLEKKVNTWNVTNSLGVIVAAILAALGLKGS
jgi:uncharacterized protein (UPF0179 family)